MNIGFPFRIGPGGRTALVDDEQYIRDLIEQVLFTAPGERVNRPTFGSGLHRLVFEPTGGELATATRLMAHGALQQWLGDLVEVQAVDITAEEATLRVTVSYRTRAMDRPTAAVFTRRLPQ
ncbi:GPW/gp25 family protein [Streptomyces griseoruber]|uniref:GPW/gp25 family protein n=1 Tax=Streptomyces griseoruber TaxID=1943 RepID=UPI0037A64CA7